MKSFTRHPSFVSSTALSLVMLLLMGMWNHAAAQRDTPCETVLNCPSDLVVTTSGTGSTAEFTVTATNECVPDLRVRCFLEDGTGEAIDETTVFPLGTNSVICEVSDGRVVLTNCSFAVIVLADTQDPMLAVPSRLIVPCTEPGGAVVRYTAAALDDMDAEPEVVCDPPSGSFFPSGTNWVICTARDAAGNRTVKQFPVIVTGDCGGGGRCLDLQVPDPIRVPCTGPDGAVVEFVAVARDTCTGGEFPLVCVPRSGSVFPIGVTKVLCYLDGDGQQGAATFEVEVTDEAPPVLTIPSNVVAEATSPLGAVVEYAVSAEDDCTAQPRIRCAPASGDVFPVGDTRVVCEASDDSGNVAYGEFVVTVTPAEPLTVTYLGNSELELKWSGEALVEAAPELSFNMEWRPVEGTPVMEDGLWVLTVPAREDSQYFRLQLVPLLPPSDRDGDGVPDREDRCPDTPEGLRVDESGCAIFDLVATPALVFEPEQARLTQLRRRMSRWPSTESLAGWVPDMEHGQMSLMHMLFARDFDGAMGEISRTMTGLSRALTELAAAQMRRWEEIGRTRETADPEFADVRLEDHELADWQEFEETLTDSLWSYRQIWMDLSNVVHAVETSSMRRQAEIVSINNEEGTAILADGSKVLLARPETEGAPDLASLDDTFIDGALVDMTVTPLSDGSSLVLAATSEVDISAQPVTELNPRRLELRVTPVDFGLPNFDLAARHRLDAYRWGFTENLSRYYLEYNQALAAKRYVSSGLPELYNNWLRIDIDLNNDGYFQSWIWKMDQTTPAKVLTPSEVPENQPFTLRVREYRAPKDGSGSTTSSEIVSEEFLVVEVNRTGAYAEALYDREAFELEGLPSSGYQVAHVTGVARRWPLTLKPLNELSFSGASFVPAGGGSTYPYTQSIGFNQPFAVHNEDPNNLLWYANPNDLPRGIYAPKVQGFNHGYYFSYRTELPLIVRDRLHDCPGSGPDTYYKIPFKGGYSVSQGNNGQFTHNGWQQFAWDFPKLFGTPVVAARGGEVIDLRESASQSCYNPFVPNNDGGLGDCINCTGNAANNFVYIRHQDGTYAWYGHFLNNGVLVNIGQKVARGDMIGLVGSTGCSTGSHLHFHVVNQNQDQTIPVRFETYLFNALLPCYLPSSNSAGISTN